MNHRFEENAILQQYFSRFCVILSNPSGACVPFPALRLHAGTFISSFMGSVASLLCSIDNPGLESSIPRPAEHQQRSRDMGKFLKNRGPQRAQEDPGFGKSTLVEMALLQLLFARF